MRNLIVVSSKTETRGYITETRSIVRLSNKDRAEGLKLHRKLRAAGIGSLSVDDPRVAPHFARWYAWAKKFDQGNGSRAYDLMLDPAEVITRLHDRSSH